MKYQVLGDYVTYGEMKQFSDLTTHAKNLSISKAIDFVREKTKAEEIEIGTVVRTPEDSMGCYSRYVIHEDKSLETIWENLSLGEKHKVFSYALNWAQNETGDGSDIEEKLSLWDGAK